MSNRVKRTYKRIKKASIKQQMKHYKRFCDLMNNSKLHTRLYLALCLIFKKL